MARWPTTIWKKSRRWCWTQVPQRVVRISSNSWVHPCWLSTHAYVELALRLFALRCFAFICLLNFVFFLFSFFSSMLPSSMPPHKHFHGYTPTHMHTLSSPTPPPPSLSYSNTHSLPDVASNVNGADASNGYRPLHMATVWGRPSMAVLLLSLGADPSLRSEPVRLSE